MLSIAELAHRRDPEAIAKIICQEVQQLDTGAIKVEAEITDSNLDLQIRTNNVLDKDKLLTLLRSKLSTLRIKSVSKFRIHCWRSDEDIYEQRLMWTEQFMLDTQLAANSPAGQNPSANLAGDPQATRSPEPQLSKNSVLQQAIAQIMPDSAAAKNLHDPSQLNRPEIHNSSSSSSAPNAPVQSSSIIKHPRREQPNPSPSYGKLLLVGAAIVLLGLGIGASVRTITAHTANAAKDQAEKPVSQPQNLASPSSNPPEKLDTTAANLPLATTTQPPAEANVITLEKFNRIEKGMTLAQVEKILGTSGKVIAENVANNSVGKVYSWKNPQGSNAIIEFKDGQVVAKAQAGL